MQSKRRSRLIHFASGHARWHSTSTGIPALAKRWLTTTGSLTAAVRAVSTAFAVGRVFEGWRPPLIDEAPALGLKTRPLVWTREVLLRDGQTPLVFAHTVASRRAVHAWPWLRGLGDKPLGEVLFQHHGVIRRPLEFCRLDPRHPVYHRAAQQLVAAGRTLEPALYARRSVFVLHGQGVLVTEVFLPELLQR